SLEPSNRRNRSRSVSSISAEAVSRLGTHAGLLATAGTRFRNLRSRICYERIAPPCPPSRPADRIGRAHKDLGGPLEPLGLWHSGCDGWPGTRARRRTTRTRQAGLIWIDLVKMPQALLKVLFSSVTSAPEASGPPGPSFDGRSL